MISYARVSISVLTACGNSHYSGHGVVASGDLLERLSCGWRREVLSYGGRCVDLAAGCSGGEGEEVFATDLETMYIAIPIDIRKMTPCRCQLTPPDDLDIFAVAPTADMTAE